MQTAGERQAGCLVQMTACGDGPYSYTGSMSFYCTTTPPHAPTSEVGRGGGFRARSLGGEEEIDSENS